MSDHSITTQPATGSALPIRWWQAVVLLCLFVSATGLGIYWGQTHIVAGIENGFLEVDAEHLDFGEVWVQDKFQWTLPITNTSSEPVEILEFRTSCNCASIEPTSLVIAPGETADVHLTLDLTTRNPEEAAKESRPFSVRIAPLINSGLAQYTGWEVQGEVRSLFTMSPPVVNFSDGLVRGAEVDPITVKIICRVPLRSLTAQCDSSLVRAELRRDASDAARFNVTVSPASMLQGDGIHTPISLRGVTAEGESLPVQQLWVRGRVVEDVLAVPSQVVLGAIAIGDSAEEIITLRSRAGKPFEVVAETPSSPSVSVSQVSGTSRGDHCFVVRQRALRPGNQSNEVRFQIRDLSSENNIEVIVAVRYLGVANGAAATSAGETVEESHE